VTFSVEAVVAVAMTLAAVVDVVVVIMALGL
jgi:hypothetical protein